MPLYFLTFVGDSWQNEGGGLIKGIFTDASAHDDASLMLMDDWLFY
jgi:hypothetical protein